MKRVLLFFCMAVLFAPFAKGQFTSVTATVKDPSGSPYVGCHANASFVPSSTATTQPLINGSVFPTSVVLAQCDSFGNAAWTLVDNNQVSDGHGGGPVSQWQFNITSQDGKTGFSCLITVTGQNQIITGLLQACAAPLPPSGGGGGNFVVKTIPCASTINFTMAGVSPNTSNTAFVINPLNCNVTTSTVVAPTGGVLQQGAVAQFTLVNAGGFSFAWPPNFIDQPTIQSGVNVTTNASFWYDGTNWHAQTFPAAGGGGGNPVGAQGTIQSTNGTTFASSNLSEPPSGTLAGSFKVSEDVGFQGQNPYVDIRTKGAVACNPNLTPCAAGLTATISLASPTTATISVASTFSNNNGVTVYGAGALNALTTPSAPTVTNVLASGGTGTGITTASAAGATTKCYKVSAADTGGGLTAASPETCTNTGQATLGAVTVNMTSFSRSGTTVTGVASAATPCLVGTGGGEVFIGGGNGLTDPSFRGWYTMATCADSTHFTWTDPVASTVNGSVASATGGTATFFPANHLALTAVANAWQYYIYCGASGAETLCGVTNPGGTNTDNTWDDFANLQTNWSFFPWIPNTPPSSATADNLATTITAGAGTTTLTLANAASTAVNGATIRLDSGPAIVAAGQNFRIPLDPNGNSFVVNSFVDLRSQLGTSIEQAGTLVLNETLATRNVRWNGVSNAPMGTGGSGSWSAGKPSVSVFGGARSGVYIANTQAQGPDIRGLSFSCSSTNGCLLALVEGGFNMNFDTDDFTTGTSANDLMGIGLYLRGSAGQSAAGVVMDKVSFSPGNNTDGASHNAGFYCNLCGDVHIKSGYSVHRGNIFSAPGGGGTIEIDNWHINGGGTPFLSVVHGGGIAGTVSLGSIIMDTIAQPCVASLGDIVSIFFKFGCSPSSGVPAVTGGSLANFVTGIGNSTPGSFATGSTSTNTLTTALLGGLTSGNVKTIVDYTGGSKSVSTDNSIFIEGVVAAAPTITVNAGGSIATGTYTWVSAPLWWNGEEGVPSQVSAPATTTSGNQGLTITYTTVAGNPQCYRLYWSNGGGYANPSTIGCTNTNPVTITSLGSISFVLGTVHRGGPSTITTQGVASPSFILGNSGFSVTQSAATLTANRSVTWPDAGGTVALSASAPITLSAAGAIACANCFNLSTSNNIGANFFDVGTRAGPGNPASGNIRLYADSTSGNLTCLTSAGANCIPGGGGGTPGGSTTQVQFNSAGAFAGSSNFTWVSPTLTLGVSGTTTGQVAFANGGASGAAATIQNNAATSNYNFNLPSGPGTSGQPLISGGGASAAMTFGTLGYGGGGTGGTAFTANQLVQSGASALSSLAGTTTGTNPILKLQPSSAANTALILDTAATPTGDVQDWNINGTKTSWVDSSAFVHTPQVTFTGSGALTLNGTNGTCPSAVAGNSILCLGDSTTSMGLLSNNGGNFKPVAQFSTAGPTAHGVGLASVTAPQINFSGAGIVGQGFLSGGASADGAYGALNLAGGSNIVTGLLPPGNGGTGASSLAGANIVTVTGAITAGHCTSWNASTVVQDSGAACGGGSSPARLDQITAGTATNTINSTTFAQTWNWALTGSTTAFKFGENTAATGSSNILLQATTANASTAVPFQTDNNGNGYQLSSVGLWKPIGTGSVAIPGTAHGVVINQGSGSAITLAPEVAAGKVLIDNGPGADPSFQDPVVSQAFVNIWNAQDITVTRTSANVRNPIFSQTATLQLTFAGITGSPATCTLQFRGVDSQGNVLNNGGTVSISPANGTTSQTFTAATTLQTAAQVSAVYACGTYPTAGTLTLDFTPIPNVNVTNTVGTTSNVTQFGGTNLSTGTGAGGAGIPRVTISNDSSLAANQSVNVNQIGGSAVSTAATGVQKVGITGNAGAAMDAAGQNVASPANELLVGCQFNTTPTTITSGNMSPAQCDNGGKMLVNVGTPAVTQSGNWTARVVGNTGSVVDQAPGSAVPANVVMEGLSDGTNSRRALSDTTGRQFMLGYPDTTTTSYHTSKKFALSSTTDIMVMPGNATNTAIVTKILFTCTQTTAGTVNVELIKRSTADTAGTSAAMTAVPDDSNYAAAVSAPLSYTGSGPTVGTAVGDLDNAQVGCPATSVAGPNDLYMFRPVKPVILRGTAQQITINLGGAVTGGTGTVTIEWYETTTP